MAEQLCGALATGPSPSATWGVAGAARPSRSESPGGASAPRGRGGPTVRVLAPRAFRPRWTQDDRARARERGP